MKARIRDLQIQAFSECKTFEDGKSRTDEVFERFAELIVRECIVTLHRRGVEGFGIVEERMLKEHFGVE